MKIFNISNILFQIISYFRFSPKSNLSDFDQVYKKYISIYDIIQIHYQNIFHRISNESTFVMLPGP
jgi:hypothetical protein